MLCLRPSLFEAFLFAPSQEVPISLKSFLVTSYHRVGERRAFCFALDGWPTWVIFGNISCFFCKTCPNHIMLSLIIALESGIEPHFYTAYRYDMLTLICISIIFDFFVFSQLFDVSQIMMTINSHYNEYLKIKCELTNSLMKISMFAS